VQRVRGEHGGVALGRYETAEGVGHMFRCDPGRVEKALPLDELHDGAAGGTRGAAPLRVETRLDDAVAINTHRDANEVTTGSAPGGAGMRPISESAEPTRGIEMVIE
jgi:hypothetical protein